MFKRGWKIVEKIVGPLYLRLLKTFIVQVRAIAKFTHRNICKPVLDDFDLPSGTNIFINQSSWSYPRIEWSKSKRVHNMGIIKHFCI